METDITVWNYLLFYLRTWKEVGSLVYDTMNTCSPSRGLTTGFQSSLQQIKNNLIVSPGWIQTPDQELSCALATWPLWWDKVQAWTILDISHVTDQPSMQLDSHLIPIPSSKLSNLLLQQSLSTFETKFTKNENFLNIFFHTKKQSFFDTVYIFNPLFQKRMVSF